MVGFLAKRLRGRPDSEHDQAIVRLALVFVLGAYLAVVGAGTEFDHGPYWLTLLVSGTYLSLSVIYMALILIWPGRSPLRRIAAMITDMTTLGVVIHFAGTSGAALYPVYLWITFGNGFRYGIRYLAASALGGMTSFAVVIALTDYWQQNPYLAGGLMMGLLILPAYVASLIRKLTEAKAEAEEASVAKSQFLATMSHELRTPLNAIIGIGGLLQKTPLNAEQSDMTRTIGASARALLSLIDRILDFSRIEAGRMPLEVVDFDLYRELGDLDRILRPQAEAKALDLQVMIDARTPPQLRGTTACLRHIVTNLGANAIKFTERGSVRIAVTGQEGVGGHVSLRVDVIDTGIGIADDAVERIFEHFTQEDQAIARRFGGAGLGLAICKQLTDLVGGRLGVETKMGEGSRFWVELPFARAAAAAQETAAVVPIWLGAALHRTPAETEASGRGLAVTADSLEAALAQRDRLAERGKTGLVVEGWAEAETRSRDSAVVTADAFDAKEAPRGWVGTRCVIVGDTAGQLTNAAHYQRVFGHGSGEAQEQRGELLPTRSLRLLVAEDNPVNRRVLAMILRRGGHQVDVAVDGDDAAEQLADKSYDLVILDVNMPGTSGIDVVRLFRFQEIGGPRTPILGLTADATERTRATCLAAGMDAVLTKPVEADVLLAKVHELTATEVTARAPDQPTEAETGEELEEASSTIMDLASHPRFRSGHTPVIDRQAIEALIRLDPSGTFMREVVDEFLADANQLLETMARFADDRDAGALRDGAHALKSSAAHVGALRVQSICSAFQASSRRDNVTMAPRTLETLRNELASYGAAIERELEGREGDQRL